jgi:6-phosphogluconolactonase
MLQNVKHADTVPTIHRFASPAELAQQLASDVRLALALALCSHDEAAIAVSGGSTPKAFFKALSHEKMDWARVGIHLVDERCVPEDSDQLNAHLVEDNLMQNQAGAATFTPLYDHTSHNAEDAARRAADNLPERGFDSVVLGMGADGHTASLFPNGDRLAEGLDANAKARIIAMRAAGAGVPRLTLTLAEILRAGRVILHIEGNDKMAVLEQALAGTDATEMPIRAVLNLAPALEIYWAPKA